MLWSKPSLLSKDGEVGLEVIYSEEQLYGELIQLPIWNPPRTHVIPSNPLTTSMRVDNYGGGLCVWVRCGER